MRAAIPPGNVPRVAMPSMRLKYVLPGELAGYILDAILATVRWDIQGEEHLRALNAAGQSFILAFWHGRLLPLGYLHRGCRHSMMISRSRDGEYGSALARHWGQIPVRGSSSRGGAIALAEMLDIAAARRTLAFTPDGPRGPRFELKPGVVVAAQKTGLPILPFSAGASRGWTLGSWDRMLVPKPFSLVRVRYGAPILVGPDDPVEPHVRRLEAELLRLTALADAAMPGGQASAHGRPGPRVRPPEGAASARADQPASSGSSELDG